LDGLGDVGMIPLRHSNRQPLAAKPEDDPQGGRDQNSLREHPLKRQPVPQKDEKTRGYDAKNRASDGEDDEIKSSRVLEDEGAANRVDEHGTASPKHAGKDAGDDAVLKIAEQC